MKIGLTEIIKGHINTFRNEDGRFLFQDGFVFLAIPLLVALLVWFAGLCIGNDVYSLSITVFSIFAALLLSVQVALFSIYIREWKKPSDDKEADEFQEIINTRRELLSDLNCNVSYLIVSSCFYVTITLLFYILELRPSFEASALSFLYMHFFFNLIMTIKRAFIMFQKEYQVE